MTATSAVTVAPMASAIIGGRRELLGAQRGLDLDGALVDAALPAATAQRRGDLRA